MSQYHWIFFLCAACKLVSKWAIFNLLQSEPGIRDNKSDQICFRERQNSQKSCGMQGRLLSNLYRDLLYISHKSDRHINPPQKCQNGWNGTECEVASMRLFEVCWLSPSVSHQLPTTGGGQGTVLIRDLLSAQRTESKYNRRWRGEDEFGEINVSSKSQVVPRMWQH